MSQILPFILLVAMFLGMFFSLGFMRVYLEKRGFEKRDLMFVFYETVSNYIFITKKEKGRIGIFFYFFIIFGVSHVTYFLYLIVADI